MKFFYRLVAFAKEKLFFVCGKLLGELSLFKDVVLAIANLTKTVNDLVKAFTQLAIMINEDREAIDELYQHLYSMQDEKLEKIVAETTKASVQPQRSVTGLKDPARIDTSWAENSKKKLVN